MDFEESIEAWKAEMYRTGLKRQTVDSYTRTVANFAKANPGLEPAGITTRHIERFISRFTGLSEKTGREYEPNTRAQRECALSRYTTFLRKKHVLEADPFLEYERTRRKPAHKQKVVTVSSEDVVRMLEEATRAFMQKRVVYELVCLSFLVYLGPRRAALAQLRRKHVDLDKGTVEFPEWKGGDHFPMEIPDELLHLLRMLYEYGLLDNVPDAYVVPNMRPNGVRNKRRDDKLIWTIVKKVARRVGVEAHAHSLRAAFACFYVDSTPNVDVLMLKEAMGHENLATTEVYMRRIKRQRAMASVRGLSWGSEGFLPLHARQRAVTPSTEAHTGFEPVLPA